MGNDVASIDKRCRRDEEKEKKKKSSKTSATRCIWLACETKTRDKRNIWTGKTWLNISLGLTLFCCKTISGARYVITKGLFSCSSFSFFFFSLSLYTFWRNRVTWSFVKMRATYDCGRSEIELFFSSLGSACATRPSRKSVLAQLLWYEIRIIQLVDCETRFDHGGAHI